MSKSLDELVEKLQISLEEKPDSWFNSPKGYLSKPDYKRQAQERAYIEGLGRGGGGGSDKKVATKRQSIFESITMLATSAYKKRYFVLDKNVNALLYYKDDASVEELGIISQVPLHFLLYLLISHTIRTNSFERYYECYTLCCI